MVAGLKFAVAVVLLAVVARSLPWGDEVTVVQPGGSQTYSGTLRGDWKSSAVAFTPDADSAPLPLHWKSELARLGAVQLQRNAEVDWKPSMQRVLSSVDITGLIVALGLLCIGVAIQTTRWWRLLAVLDCQTSWVHALRLGLYGLFFNLIVPGQMGGDVVRAMLVARQHPERRAAAAVSVLVDRFLSLLLLGLLCMIVIVLEGERFAGLRIPVVVALGIGAAAAVCYTNPTLRRAVNVEFWLARMPFARSMAQIDEALLLYSRRPAELLLAAFLSICIHICIAASILVLGAAFGDRTVTPMQYVAVSAIGNIAGLLPITPGGWGLSEAVYQHLFEGLGADGTIGVAISVTYKLLFGLIGACGGLFLLAPSAREQLSMLKRRKAGA